MLLRRQRRQVVECREALRLAVECPEARFRAAAAMQRREPRLPAQSAAGLTSEAARQWAARRPVEFLAPEFLAEQRTPQRLRAVSQATRALPVGSRALTAAICLRALGLVEQCRAAFLAPVVLAEPHR